MKKRVVDIPAQDLDRLAGHAWQDAATRSLGRGVAVVGRQGEQLTKIFPDGRQETIGVAAGPEAPREAVQSAQTRARRRKARQTA